MNVQDTPIDGVAVIRAGARLLRFGLCFALLGCADLKSGSDRASRLGDSGMAAQDNRSHDDGSVAAMGGDGGDRAGLDADLHDGSMLDGSNSDGSNSDGSNSDGSVNDGSMGDGSVIDAGNGGIPDSGSGAAECPLNFVCAEVGLPSDFSGTIRKIELRLESDPFVPGSSALPAATASYPPIESPPLTKKKPYDLHVDFTQPLASGAFKGKRYAAIYVFRSTQSDAVPEIDYWFRTTDLLRFAFDSTFDLGSVVVERIPRIDDAATKGNDAVGVVACGSGVETLCEPDADHHCCCNRDSPTGCTCGTTACQVDTTGKREVGCDGPEDCGKRGVLRQRLRFARVSCRRRMP